MKTQGSQPAGTVVPPSAEKTPPPGQLQVRSGLRAGCCEGLSGEWYWRCLYSPLAC